ASANVQIGNLDCFWAGSDCVHVLSAGTVFIDNAILSHFNEDNNGSTGLNAGTSGYIAVATPPAVGSPANGGTLIPPSPSGGTYAMPVSQNWTPSVIGTTTTGTV